MSEKHGTDERRIDEHGADTHHFDLIVLGAGAVGENVADYAHQQGLSVALVEEALVGGECSYWACMPSKALLRSSLALLAAQRLDGARQVVGEHTDAEAVLARRTSFTHDWNDSSQVEWAEGAGLIVLRGHATIVGVGAVEVDGVRYSADSVAVATGSSASIPPVDGIASITPWTPKEATSAKEPPEHLIIVGGGVVAVELATAWRLLGSEVTVLARSSILRGQEPFAGEAVSAEMSALGIDVHIGASLLRVAPGGSGAVGSPGVAALYEDASGQHEVLGSTILFATGRTPNTTDVGLENVGLTPGHWLSVDDTMLVQDSTNAERPWLYAVGDVNHRALLTHQGKYQARAAGRAIAARHLGRTVNTEPWSLEVATADHHAVPQVVFSSPEVAHVGFTEQQARDAELNIRAVEYNLGWVAGASLQADGYEGNAKFIVDEDKHVLIGATFVGQDTAELLYAATIAVVGQVPIERLWHAVPSYPTMSEIWLRFLETYSQS